MKKVTKVLIGLERVTEFIKIILASGLLKNEKPLSIILKADVSSGKTTAIKQFKDNKTIEIITDLTAWGIITKYQGKLRNQEIKHFIVPDFLNALSRRKTTTEPLLTFINASCEDGLFPSKTFGCEIQEYIEPFGWILCLTNEGYEIKKKKLIGMGFENRFFIVSHKYSQETIDKILTNIIDEDIFTIPNIKISDYSKRKIKGDKVIFRKLETYSKLLVKEGASEILRIQRKLQTFLKASALLRKDDKVTEKDLNKLEELIDLIK